MKNRIITISREFGSGGRYIGEETASVLPQMITSIKCRGTLSWSWQSVNPA